MTGIPFEQLADRLDIRLDVPTKQPDPARLPAIVWNAQPGWILIVIVRQW